MKHLKVRARLSDDKNLAYVTVLEQTNIGATFGDGISRFSCATYKGVIDLVSDGIDSPYDEETEGPLDHFIERSNGAELYVNGISDWDKRVEYPIPQEFWPAIKEAVEQYNEYFKEK